jgi:hypothetical protein
MEYKGRGNENLKGHDLIELRLLERRSFLFMTRIANQKRNRLCTHRSDERQL